MSGYGVTSIYGVFMDYSIMDVAAMRTVSFMSLFLLFLSLFFFLSLSLTSLFPVRLFCFVIVLLYDFSVGFLV